MSPLAAFPSQTRLCVVGPLFAFNGHDLHDLESALTVKYGNLAFPPLCTTVENVAYAVYGSGWPEYFCQTLPEPVKNRLVNRAHMQDFRNPFAQYGNWCQFGQIGEVVTFV